jgi:hypothetical protein
MDDMEFLVEETFRINGQKDVPRPIIPQSPGVLYHMQDGAAVFAVRTLVVDDVAEGCALVLAHPEEYPSLRLLEDNGDPESRLRWFSTETRDIAQHLHERVGQRRFPKHEADVCNLSDPGYSWWLETAASSLRLHGKLHRVRDGVTCLGPLHDVNIGALRWGELSKLLPKLPVDVEVEIGSAKFGLASEGAPWLVEEFTRVFSTGDVSQELRELFRLMGKRGGDPTALESCWFFLQEAAAVRRFWRELQT